jgi:hypothetical protein
MGKMTPEDKYWADLIAKALAKLNLHPHQRLGLPGRGKDVAAIQSFKYAELFKKIKEN